MRELSRCCSAFPGGARCELWMLRPVCIGRLLMFGVLPRPNRGLMAPDDVLPFADIRIKRDVTRLSRLFPMAENWLLM